ncbi:ribokinase [Arthrobacter sp. E3]|uniref:ribokinase n=1 Tax=Arthrobacter sp. E3 TaxID=517402 RepID=UPI001A945563|nr:ribokinase [Arthrobacter sp. E3]
MKSTDDAMLPTGSAIVLGSINVDTFIHVDSFPEPGETILARSSAAGLGGKGANQAMAAALLGAEVQFLAQIGEDMAGDFAREQLDSFGVSRQLLMTSDDDPTGAAHVTVNSQGENTIAVVPGANARICITELSQKFLQALDLSLAPITVGLAQGETSVEAVEAFARQCQALGIRFVLNLAPFIELNKEVLALADPLIMNEGEAQTLLRSFTGCEAPLEDLPSALAAAQLVAEKLAKSAIITLGTAGAVASDGAGSWHQPSPLPEQVVDTTGAGDAFAGAAVALLSGGASLRDAVCAGVAAGSIAVRRTGTASSYPCAKQLALLMATGKIWAP